MPLIGQPNVQKLKSKRDIKGLVKALSSSSKFVYQDAEKALIELADPAAIPPLLKLLDHSRDQELLKHVIFVLGKLGDERAAKPLLDGLSSKMEDDTNCEIVRALGNLKCLEAVQPMISWCEEYEGEKNVQYYLEEALANIGGDQAADYLVAGIGSNISSYKKSLLQKVGKPIVKSLLEKFCVFSEDLQAASLDIIEEVGIDETVFEPLISLLPVCTSSIQKRIAASLEQSGYVPQNEEDKCWYSIAKRDYEKVIPFGPAALEKLSSHLFSTTFDDRKDIQNGTAAMLEIDRQAGLKLLLQAVKESSLFNAENVLFVLGKKNIKEANPCLIKFAESDCPHENHAKCVHLVNALTKLQAWEIEPLLIEMISSGDERLKKAALRNLLLFPQNPRIIEAFIQAVRNEDYVDVKILNNLRDVLIKDGEVRALPALLEAYKGRSRSNFKPLLEFGQAAIPVLEENLNHPDKKVRTMVSNFLRDLGWKPDSGQTSAQHYVNKRDWRSAEALGEAALKPLCSLLDSDIKLERLGAVKTLGNIRHTDAIDRLIPILDDRDNDVRQAVRIALMKIFDANKDPVYLAPFVEKNVKVAELIAKLETSSDEVLRIDTAEELGEVFDPRAVQCLRKMLLDPFGRIRGAASYALYRLDETVWEKALEGRSDGILNLKRLHDPRLPVLELLDQNLEHKDISVREDTVRILEQSGHWAKGRDKDDFSVLLNKALKNDNAKITLLAAKILKDNDELIDLQPLLSLLDTPHEQVRMEVIDLLGYIGDEKAAGPLLQQLSETECSIQLEALKALGKIEATLEPEPFTRFLSDNDPLVRLEAIKIFGKIGGAAAFDALQPLLSDESQSIRIEAVLALGQSGDARVTELLISKLDKEALLVKQAVIQALGETGDRKAVDVLIQQSSAAEKGSAKSLALALRAFADDPRVVAALIGIADFADRYEIDEVAKSLRKAKKTAPVEKRIEIKGVLLKLLSRLPVPEIVRRSSDFLGFNVSILAAKIKSANKSEREKIAEELVELYPVQIYDNFGKQKQLSGIIEQLRNIDPGLVTEIEAANKKANDDWHGEWERRSR